MQKNLTEMIFILDRSGSMQHLTNDTIGGFNSLIEKQKNEDGEAYVTTVLFDDRYTLLHDHVNIQDVKPITEKEYFARGLTALLDAVGKTINSVGERLSNTPEDERPEKVMVTIITDGFENASREFNKAKVKEMITHQQDKYSWVFMFLGANMDAVAEARSYGINESLAATYHASGLGTASAYNVVADATSCLRSAASFTDAASANATIDSMSCIVKSVMDF